MNYDDKYFVYIGVHPSKEIVVGGEEKRIDN
jgi:hypothetical protein